MNTPESWINTTLPLPRPEYAKQPESLLTDLLWNSPGSTLSTIANGDNSYLDELTKLRTGKKDTPTDRLVPRRARGGKPGTIETIPIAENAQLEGLIIAPEDCQLPTGALLESILAPQSRGDKSIACVPIHPDAVVLQTLQGLVNKDSPPNLAKAIEVVGWLGGSRDRGHVAAHFLEIFAQRANSRDGLTGLVDAVFPAVSQYTWNTLINMRNGGASIPPWPGVGPLPRNDSSLSALAAYERTPFHWFWEKWAVLCTPTNGWYDKLSHRRFTDWATCLLRTSLAFAYLWEADFFYKLYLCIKQQADSFPNPGTLDLLLSMLKNGAALASIESPRLPATQKHAWNALSTVLARGYLARKRCEECLLEEPFAASTGDAIEITLQKWIDSLPRSNQLQKLAMPLQIENQTAKNTKEFVRYLLQPRSSDDDSADQADFYYLARINSRSFWFQPGPEWLVVVTSLLSGHVGGHCTLGMLIDDLAKLGVRIERWVLIGMLEEAGLSVDSPDADNALVIRSGF